ncbi:MAG: XRE family transcriptional regulator [Sphingomonadales bacterium]|nr:XRE family transcriptional regulator [Sphingomonadales bacterium]
MKTQRGHLMENSMRSGLQLKPGAALKSIRTERGLTLADVSKLTGFTVSTLSKIENDKVDVTVDKLLRITLALEVNAADLFGTVAVRKNTETSSMRRSITRAGEGKSVSVQNGHYSYHAFDILNKNLTPIIGEVTAKSLDEFGDFHRHVGEEFVYVLEGELALYTDVYAPAYLSAGDSIYFDSSMGHAYVAVGDASCRIVSVFTTSESDILQMIQSSAKPISALSGGSKTKKSA